MPIFPTSSFPAFVSPIQLEFFSGVEFFGLFALFAAFVIFLGLRSLNGLGVVRKWVVISIRLLVVLLLLLVIGGVRHQRINHDVEVIVLKDVSDSTHQFTNYPGASYSDSLNQYLRDASGSKYKQAKDRIGVIGFDEDATIEALPNTTLDLSAKPIETGGDGTDIAGAIQLGLATFRNDSLRRLVLVSDGNPTQGDLDAAVAAAASQHIPIDVMPLHYDVSNATLMDNIEAPSWKHENEPFTIYVRLRSTDPNPVVGELSVTEVSSDGSDNVIDINTTPSANKRSRTVTLRPGLNKVPVTLPAEKGAGVRQFKAVFDNPAVRATADAASRARASAFTFVRGSGQVLFVDNVSENGDTSLSQPFRNALADQNINVKAIQVDHFPSLIELQTYDAVILANVPCGLGGLNEQQDRDLATYVHDLGGGLVMIGGEQTFGAGGWSNSKTEQVLPVQMDIPAQRQIAKGALVVVMHSCEMPGGNALGEACTLSAVDALSARDDIGVVVYGGQGNGPTVGGASWQYVLGPVGNREEVHTAIKKMDPGDMPSFDDSMTVALDGINGGPGLVANNARNKHIIVLSDGDPVKPADRLITECTQHKISISTVTVYPHMVDPLTGVAPVMRDMANETGGKWYGPIEKNPNQLPQIFIKEATVVRRSLIYEDKEIPVKMSGTPSDAIKGIDAFPPITGMILTARKNLPQVEIPLLAGKNDDPLLAHWQAGLGKALVFTSDMHNKWAASWLASPMYEKFWSQCVRMVLRPPMSTDFDVNVQQGDGKGHITVDALKRETGFLNFLEIRGTVISPSGKAQEVRLVQTAPGQYSADFEGKAEGNYVAVLDYRGQDDTKGILVGGMTVNTTPEMRDLHSNDDRLKQIAEATGGRMLEPFDTGGADLFTREGLYQTSSPRPIWDLMIPWLLALILLDVAARRIAWDWASIVKMTRTAGTMVRDFTTTTRAVENAGTMDALKRVRGEVAETKFKPADPGKPRGAPAPPPDRAAKFEAKMQVEGDISEVVGGASDKPLSPSAQKQPKGGGSPAPGDHTGGLLEAKRRAQQQIRQKEEGKQE